ncbi:hypothetical protein Pan241w_19930 [Gimesia alba]|uniref:Uncharacterized protein n=1 Tax=Gimesia alba TaxID=2527973 RepID=A0A517RDJ3_9PLAN|nr:hypothetical protein Pan241w_19930 [Gimesia alba]
MQLTKKSQQKDADKSGLSNSALRAKALTSRARIQVGERGILLKHLSSTEHTHQ